jgi:hypothetical protein
MKLLIWVTYIYFSCNNVIQGKEIGLLIGWLTTTPPTTTVDGLPNHMPFSFPHAYFSCRLPER